jgi:hypothetical protein
MPTTLDKDAHYTHPDFRGIALYIADEPVTESREVTTMVDHYDAWGHDDHDIEDCGGTHTEYDYELTEREGWVHVVMVGDDSLHAVEVDQLTVISDDDYCGGCGQIGCGH